MTTEATLTCYIQPTTAACEAMAWVDTSCTTVIRRAVTSAAEAAAVLSEARKVAAAMGRPVTIKKLVTTRFGSRAPAGVKRMQGAELVA